MLFLFLSEVIHLNNKDKKNVKYVQIKSRNVNFSDHFLVIKIFPNLHLSSVCELK